ncbi:ATP-binding protein [Pseudoalteromonas sp. SMS1]|uniref:hybrid sensor histidine kinase/response regulator n=1 Tax=Pseudoalteromonas sp. SMS1 TaxID=2908894 RepID=UPI001F2FC47C|nr:ATP-binding protein [Pseudoalteromonas sp. SMS1]MCF2858083.1 ATP-binding protein [Pseudoalteromonas sp. SMS1]
MSFLRQFHTIVSDQTLSTDEKIQSLLTFGLEVFSLDIAIVSKVVGENYEILYVESDNPDLTPTCTFDLGGTYCTHTLKANKALSFHCAGQSTISTHPCYINFQLESYIGAPIRVGKETMGTVNFSSPNVSAPFTAAHIDYVELFAQWLGSEFARRQAESVLRNNYKTLQKMEEVASIGSWRIDLESKDIFWSNQTKLIHDLNIIDKPKLDLWLSFFENEDCRQTFSHFISEAITHGTPWEVELPVVTQIGRRIWVSLHGEAQFNEGKCTSLFGSLQDITHSVELRETLKAQRREAEMLLDERSHFLSKISHEMRTPLNGISGLLINSLEEQNPDKRTENVQLALRSADILLGLVNEVLDFSKISQEGLSLSTKPTDLPQVMSDIVELYKQLITSPSVDFEANINLCQDYTVECDPVRLNQIITNLLSNALKFTPQGKIQLSVHTHHIDTGIVLHIIVSDSGIGMSPASLASLFQPFKQGEEEVGSRYGGTGLGMSIVKELIDVMNGDIDVQSKLGEGSLFKVSIPLQTTSKCKQDTPFQENTPFDASKLNVLVVEDNEINQKVMEAFLQKFNVTSDFASNGEVALQKCSVKSYDLVFMDSVMPVMDGPTTARNLIKQKLLPNHAHIVALTGNTSAEDKAVCEQAGMQDFLSKPIELMPLAEALSNCLEKIQAHSDI